MRVRTFRVPFERVVPDDAHELEFGPDDYLVIRPLFGLPAAALQGWLERVNNLPIGTESPHLIPDEVAQIVVDLLAEACTEWSLADADGKSVPKPATAADLRSLPGALAGNLFLFLTSFRGDKANPTTPR